MKKSTYFLAIMVLMVAFIALTGCGTKKEDTNAAAEDKPALPTLVTLVNGTTEVALTADDFADMNFELEVTEANLRKDALFGGIKLSDLMTKAGAENCSIIKIIAKDKMTVEIKAEDALNYPIYIANTQNGEKIPTGEGGPVKLIFPYNQYPDLEELYKPAQWCWFVVTVEFV
ncbi:MAG: molybdopterin-dependent oxidoreductase [Bacillota bacterium]|jgi:hypothetical protein